MKSNLCEIAANRSPGMRYAFDSRRASKLKAMFLAESGDMSTETTSLAPPSAAKTETIPQPAPTSRKLLPARAGRQSTANFADQSYLGLNTPGKILMALSRYEMS